MNRKSITTTIPPFRYIRLLAIFLVTIPNLSFGYNYNGIRYEEIEGGGVEIWYFQSEFDDVERLVIPGELPTDTGPKPVTHIKRGAFPESNIIQEIVIPDSVIFIEGNGDAFRGCEELLHLRIGSGLVNSDWLDYFIPFKLFSFDVAEGNPVYASMDGVLFNKELTELLHYPKGRAGPYSIPGTVQKIGPGAFYFASSLSDISFPDHPIEIGSGAFNNCNSLTVLNLPDTIQAIPESAFAECSFLNSVNLGNGVKVIGHAAFFGCSALTNLVIPDQVTTVEEAAFAMCSALSDVEIGSGLSLVHPLAFVLNESLASLTVDSSNPFLRSENNVLYSKDMDVLMLVPTTASGEFTVPSSVRFVRESAFYGCGNLTTVVLPEGLEEIESFAFAGCLEMTFPNLPDSLLIIGDRAFQNCVAFETVWIGTGLVSLAPNAFRGCSGIQQFIVSEDNLNFSSIDGVLFNKTMTQLVRYPLSRAGSYAVPQSILDIGEDAFMGCLNLEGVEFGNNLEIISQSAFRDCDSLGTIVFGNGLTVIESSAFYGCDALTTLWLPEGITRIGQSAFSSCQNLTSITIPSSVKSIEGNAFRSCPKLITVDLGDGIEQLGDSVFIGCNALVSIILPQSVTDVGKDLFWYCDSLATIEIRGALTELDERFAVGCRNLQSVTLPNTLLSIGKSAFFDCNSLQQITLPTGLQSIGESCFRRSGLTRIEIPGTVDRIGIATFADCDSLTNVTLNYGLLYIEGSAFSDCPQLSSVSIPDSTVSVGDGAFSGCDGMVILEFGNSLESIGERAFSGCSLLYSVELPDSLLTLEKQAFYNCDQLRNLSLGLQLQTIESEAFSSCDNMTQIEIPQTVSLMGSGVFKSCNLLESIIVDVANPYYSSLNGVLFNKEKTLLITFPPNKSGSYFVPSSVLEIASEAFLYCNKLTDIEIPYSVSQIGRDAFSACALLTAITVDEASPYFFSLEGVLFNKDKTRLIKFPDNKAGYYSIPSSVIEIEEWAFRIATKLTGIVIPPSLGEIPDFLFNRCRLLSKVKLNEGLTSIGHEAFAFCRFTKISIPPSVESIAGDAFYASPLQEIYFQGNAPQFVQPVGLYPAIKIYFLSGADGFTEPFWMGYPSIALDPVSINQEDWMSLYVSNPDLTINDDLNGIELLQTYALGTDLNQTIPIFPIIQVDNNLLTIEFFSGRPGIEYTVEFSEDLSNWSTEGVMLTPSEVPFHTQASIPASTPSTFLRVTVQEL